MTTCDLARFVREVLGCGCPDELLRSIIVNHRRRMPGIDIKVTRLDVGGRLLVYVVPAVDPQTFAAVVAASVRAGVSERDRRHFNRFRLVLAGANPGELEPAAREAFDACEQVDERAHLHVVAVKDCPGSIGDS